MSTTVDLTPECKLEPQQAQRLRDAYDKAVRAPSAGGYTWRGLNDIPTMAGLGGQFLWTENQPPTIMSFTVVSTDQQGVSRGTYKSATVMAPGVTVEQGKFHAVPPENPAIGFAFIELTPQGGGNTRGYIVEGMTTDSNGVIWNMKLESMASEQEFWAVRMTLT